MQDTAYLRSWFNVWVGRSSGWGKKGTLSLQNGKLSFIREKKNEVIFNVPLDQVTIRRRTLLNAFLLQLIIDQRSYRFTFSRWGLGNANFFAATKKTTEIYDRWRTALSSVEDK